MTQKFGNCWTHAIPKWWKKGGYIVVRRSGYMAVPHVMWTDNLSGVELEEFAPVSKQFKGLAGFVRSFFHFGHVQTIKEDKKWTRKGFPGDAAMVVYFVGCGVVAPILLLALIISLWF